MRWERIEGLKHMEQGEKRQIKETDGDKQRAAEERCFTCEARNYLSTVTTAAAPALPQLLRHFVLLSHTDTLAHTHLLTHALSVSVSFNPPCLSIAFSPVIPPSFHHLLFAIYPSLSAVSASPYISRTCSLAAQKLRKASWSWIISLHIPPSHAAPSRVSLQSLVHLLRVLFPFSLNKW